MSNYRHQGDGLSNVNSDAGNDGYSNIQNMNAMTQEQNQDQDQGRVPYVYYRVWYSGTPNNVSNLHTNYRHHHPETAMATNMNGYTYPNPPPARDMDFNGYNGGYYFNQPVTPYAGGTPYVVNHIQNNHYYHPSAHGSYQLQQQPQLQLQPQPQPGPLFDAGRGRISGRYSSGRYSRALQAGGRSRCGLRDNKYINNNNATSSSQVMGNISQRLMRMTTSEGQRSTDLQGHAERHDHAIAEAAAGFSRGYSNAKFFVIKSQSRQNVVNSIKHGVWTSSRGGNRILAQAYGEACLCRSVNASCPVFLFFSVRSTGNFCGVAEMDGPVDFEASAGCWDRAWKGKFPVKWNIVKNVPFSQFEHITINADVGNQNQIQVIYGRDAEQVGFDEGEEMLDIFNSYPSTSSLLDDVSMSTAPPQQRSHHQEGEEDKEKKKEKEKSGEKESERSCSGCNSCDTNADKAQKEAIECGFCCIHRGFDKGEEMLDIFNSYLSTSPLLDDASMSMSTAPPRQQSHHQEGEEEKEKEKSGEKESEHSCSGCNNCDTNADQAQTKAIDCGFSCIHAGFDKGEEIQDIFNSYLSTSSLMDDASMSTTPPQQQSHHQKGQEEKPKKKKKEKEKEKSGEKESDQSCSGCNSCDTNADQAHREAIEDSPSEMQLHEIVNTDEIIQRTTQEIKINVDAICDTDETYSTDSCGQLHETTKDAAKQIMAPL